MRLKTLNGAPLPQHLDFNERTLFAPKECDVFTAPTTPSTPSGSTTTLKWRRVGLKDTRLPTGWSQPFLPGSGRLGIETDLSMPFSQINDTSTMFAPDSTLLDTTLDLDQQPSTAGTFLEHSLVFHDTLLSSQVVKDAAIDDTISSSSFLTTSMNTTASDLSSPTRNDGPTLLIKLPPQMTITPLHAVPTAHYLRSMYPQTLTLNFLCVLVTQPERREVFVRKGGYRMELYEITVADDTNSGFKITFWLQPPRESNNAQSKVRLLLLQTLEDLQAGDILLLRNIALTSFRDVVHGQSLNPSIARARTTIHVLMKSTGVLTGDIGGLPKETKEAFKRVKRWARTHVVMNDGGSRKRLGSSTGRNTPGKRERASSVQDESLPPDTLESV
jgi:hypothetical protein